MDNVPIKSTGNQLAATEWNPNQTENENVVTSVDDSLGGDNFQLARATATYASGADYYTESGSADAYVLAPVGNKKAPHAYFVGMRVRFRTANANTGASTVNVATLGVKNIKKADGSADPAADDINTRQDTVLVYDGTNFRLPLKELQLPPLHLSIFTENDSTDPAKDILFKAGKARDILDTFDINLQTNFIKQLDSVWVAGTGNGGRASGVALSASTTYHKFVIAKPDGTADCGYDTALNATNLLADATGYTKYRKVGSIITDSSSNIILYTAYPTAGGSVKYLWKTPILNFNVNDPGTSAVLFSLTVPAGIKTDVLFNALCKDAPAAPATIIYFSSPDATDQAPSLTVSPLANIGGVASALQEDLKKYEVTTNTSSQIRMRVNQSGSGLFVRVATLGYTDRNVD